MASYGLSVLELNLLSRTCWEHVGRDVGLAGRLGHCPGPAVTHPVTPTQPCWSPCHLPVLVHTCRWPNWDSTSRCRPRGHQPKRFPTLQRVLDEPQLADDVSGNIGLYSLANFGVSFCSFQEMVKLLWVKLLDGENQEQLRSETLQS